MEGHPERPEQPTGGWTPPTQPTQQWQQPPPPPPPPPPQQPPPTAGGDRNRWLPFVLAAVVLLLIAGGAVVALGGGEDEAEAQTVRFQQPTDPGPAPFTKPADVRGRDKVKVGSGPFGGTGSDFVCDRDLLISSLRARPDRLRAWARVLGVRPTIAGVTRSIRRLRPVTLTRDTRVTNHSFVNGRAVAFQSILQAGTAVLVDASGRPVVRCRCGNPLLEPVYIPEAKCIYCPADYTPPPPCNDYTDCWRRYPHPPPVVIYAPPPPREPERPPEQTSPPPQEEPAPRGLQCDPPTSQLDFERCRDAGRLPEDDQGTPQDDVSGVPDANVTPPVGTTGDTYTLRYTNFAPGDEVVITVRRPDGVEDQFSGSVGPDGTGSFTFPTVDNRLTGTYQITVAQGQRVASANAIVEG